MNLLVFWALGTNGVQLGVPFFLWVGIFNLVTIAQFWSFAADIYTEEQGKRLFPIVGIGSSIGAVGGAAIARPLIKLGSPYTLMIVAAAISDRGARAHAPDSSPRGRSGNDRQRDDARRRAPRSRQRLRASFFMIGTSSCSPS